MSLTPALISDIAFCLGDAPDSCVVVFGARTTRGLLDSDEMDQLAELGLTPTSREITLYILPGSLPGLAVDDTVTVDGDAFVVRKMPVRRTDGLVPIRLAASTAPTARTHPNGVGVFAPVARVAASGVIRYIGAGAWTTSTRMDGVDTPRLVGVGAFAVRAAFTASGGQRLRGSGAFTSTSVFAGDGFSASGGGGSFSARAAMAGAGTIRFLGAAAFQAAARVAAVGSERIPGDGAFLARVAMGGSAPIPDFAGYGSIKYPGAGSFTPRILLVGVGDSISPYGAFHSRVTLSGAGGLRYVGTGAFVARLGMSGESVEAGMAGHGGISYPGASTMFPKVNIAGAGGIKVAGAGAFVPRTALAGAGSIAASFTVLPGIAFRETLAYVTDGSGDVSCLGSDGLYPLTKTDGAGKSLTFGWADTINNQVNRSLTVDVRLAGYHIPDGGGSQTNIYRFYVDLPDGPGTYALALACGDAASNASSPKCAIYQKDESTLIATVHSGTHFAGGHFMDATGAVLTSAAWPGSNATTSLVATDNRLVFKMSTEVTGGYFAPMTYLKLVRTA